MIRSVALGIALMVIGLGWRPVQAQELDDVLARYYEAMGGLAHTKSVNTVTMAGTVSIPMQGLEMPVTVYQARPNKVRTESTFQGATMVQAFDGTSAWMISPLAGTDEPQRIPPAQAQGLAEQADFDGPLYDYEEKGYQVELVGTEEVDGTEAIKLRIVMDDGAERFFFLDAERYLPLQAVAHDVSQGQAVELVTAFDDFREVSGIQVPHSITSKVNGQVMSHLVVTRVDVNPDLDPSMFTMPATGASGN